MSENTNTIPMQETSLDIWDTKYRLKDRNEKPVDESILDTKKRVARTLANVEKKEVREKYYSAFLWALDNGAIPAGRILSSAGAEEYKPAVSAINCTVSGTINDSMDDVLSKNHEAGLTLKAGCGIGYEFSTLRPKGAYVAGAGATTSGPLSFMDIFDKMCFTVSSAGGRRGAQMATFDIHHPDILEFIKAKREDGRLRQFNLSLLITKDFIKAVQEDDEWDLSFPITKKEVDQENLDLGDWRHICFRPFPVKNEEYIYNEVGDVACRIYKTVQARDVWNAIMQSTYDFAEPGFILIDEVNEMNNNWFCENIRATNPCVTGDTRVLTPNGYVEVSKINVGDLIINIKGDAVPVTTVETHDDTDVYEVELTDGSIISATAAHIFHSRKAGTGNKQWQTDTRLNELMVGDLIRVCNPRIDTGIETPYFEGLCERDKGFFLGIMLGDGCFTEMMKYPKLTIGHDQLEWRETVHNFLARVGFSYSEYEDRTSWQLSFPTNFGSKLLEWAWKKAKSYDKELPEFVYTANKEFLVGLLDGLLSTDGNVNMNSSNPQIRLTSTSKSLLKGTKAVMALLGIHGKIYRHKSASVIEGRQVNARDSYNLTVINSGLAALGEVVTLSNKEKQSRLSELLLTWDLGGTCSTTSRIRSITPKGKETVYDLYESQTDTWITEGGVVSRGCGEQPLPPYGSCLLGSVNLTCFVEKPFTSKAHFNFDKYRRVVAIFTRMLDNVVEINGLPLEGQRDEIKFKRRHGMGILGLGSTLAMLGGSYGSESSVAFTENVVKVMALEGWRQALELSKEKGPAPIMNETFVVTEEMLIKRPKMVEDGYKVGDKIKGKVLHARYSNYMNKIAEVDKDLVNLLSVYGARFTHHTSIAPTGTISLSLANNASNGIEPSFAHHYSRNVIRQGKKTKEKVDVFSYELLAYRHLVNPKAMPFSDDPDAILPNYFVSADDVTPKQHVDIQAAAQKWVDSSISKTANVPTEFPFDKFKDIYMYAAEKGLKGCTTFRFNPEAFQGVLVKESDLENTTYRFVLEDGTKVTVKGNDEVEYDGEKHNAANLFDSLKEGTYGKY